MIQILMQKWAAFVDRMNRLGIPVFTVRDPKTGTGSITAALVVFSAGLFGLCIIFLLATAITKTAGLFTLTEVTVSQVKMAADYSFQFLLAALGAYLGRHLQKGGDSEAIPTTLIPQKKLDNPD
jgi:hypothetical protein